MTQVLSITPTRFIASAGKLDSDRNYIFRVTSNETFVFPRGRTIDLPTRGIVYDIFNTRHVTGTTSAFTAAFDRMNS
jgi:hypothetical protein